MSEYLKLTILDGKYKTTKTVSHCKFRNKPFSVSDVFLAPLQDFELLTKGEDVKRVYDIKLSMEDINFDFSPGDVIGILPCNDTNEIKKLLIRLNVENQAEEWYNLEISKDTTKKNPLLPKHIPNAGIVEDIFKYYIDIRKPPKKLFLKALIPYTTDPQDLKLLEEACSPKGSKLYASLITGSAQTLLGLLDTFPSCAPPIRVILEHSLPLQPRYFSIASSPLEINALHITFFVVENEDGTKGVCTGWLEKLINQNGVQSSVPIYFRQSNSFRIPSDLSIPLIMIASGTGLAPFKGFLDHRLLSKRNGECNIGEAILFYGCRYPDRDFLYSGSIEEYLSSKVLSKLYVAHSRISDEKCYIQHKIDENGEQFVHYIQDKNAVVYVCGNAKTMVKDVKEAVVNNLVKHGNLDLEGANGYLNELVKSNKFIIDTWS